MMCANAKIRAKKFMMAAPRSSSLSSMIEKILLVVLLLPLYYRFRANAPSYGYYLFMRGNSIVGSFEAGIALPSSSEFEARQQAA